MSEYFDRITANCQPHTEFNLEWSQYSSREFGEVFLPKVNRIFRESLKMHDGGELFQNLNYLNGKFVIFGKKMTLKSTVYTYPSGVLVSNSTDKIKLSDSEFITFIQIDDQDNLLVSFRLGKEIKSEIELFLIENNFNESLSNLEFKKYNQKKIDLQFFFKNGYSQYDILNYFFQLNNLDIKNFKQSALKERFKNFSKSKLKTYPEHEELDFDAALGDTKLFPNSWTHGLIEAKALEEIGFSLAEGRQVYYGNWLRDLSSPLSASIMGFHFKTREKLHESPFKDVEWIRNGFNSLKYKPSHQAWVNAIRLFSVKFFFYDGILKPTSNFPDYEKKFVSEFGELTKDVLGIYRPEEHIDNPKKMINERWYGHKDLIHKIRINKIKGNGELFQQTFYPGLSPISHSELSIDDNGNMKNYIKVDGPMVKQSANFPDELRLSAFSFLKEQLKLSSVSNDRNEQLRHFGAALHVIEDYYAHTNFVEISIIKNANAVRTKIQKIQLEENKLKNIDAEQIFQFMINFFPWVELKALGIEGEIYTNGTDKIIKIPIVTGTFATEDAIASMANKLASLLLPSIDQRPSPPKPRNRSALDRLIIIFLSDYADQERNMPIESKTKFTPLNFTYQDILSMYITLLDYIDDYRTVKDTVNAYVDPFLPDWYKRAKDWTEEEISKLLDSFEFFANFVLDTIMKGIAKEIKESQPMNFGTDPTHTQIAKDSLNHPLNPIAGIMAVEAVKDISQMMFNHWQNPESVTIDEIIEHLDKIYIVHPSDTIIMDQLLQNWIIDNIQNIDKLEIVKHEHSKFPTGYATGKELDAMLKVPKFDF